MKSANYPDDVLMTVFGQCSMKDLIGFRLVTRQWKRVVDNLRVVSFNLSDFSGAVDRREGKKLWLVLTEEVPKYQWDSSKYKWVPATKGKYKWKGLAFKDVCKSEENGLDFSLRRVKTIDMKFGGERDGLFKAKILTGMLKRINGIVPRPQLKWLHLEEIVYPEYSGLVDVINSTRLNLKVYASYILNPVIMAPVTLNKVFKKVDLEFGPFRRSWGIHPNRTLMLKSPVDIVRIAHGKLRSQSMDIAPIWSFLNSCESIDSFILECNLRGSPPDQKFLPPTVRKLVAWNCTKFDLHQVAHIPLVSHLEEIHSFYDCGVLTKVVHPNLKKLYVRHPRDGFWVPSRLWYNIPTVDTIATDHENEEVGIIPMLAAFQITNAHTLYYKLPFAFNFNPMVLHYLMRLPTLTTLHLHLAGDPQNYYLYGFDSPKAILNAKDLLRRISIYCPNITTLTIGGAFDYYFKEEKWIKAPKPRTPNEFNPFNERSSTRVDLDLLKITPDLSTDEPPTPISPSANGGNIILD